MRFRGILVQSVLWFVFGLIAGLLILSSTGALRGAAIVLTALFAALSPMLWKPSAGSQLSFAIEVFWFFLGVLIAISSTDLHRLLGIGG